MSYLWAKKERLVGKNWLQRDYPATGLAEGGKREGSGDRVGEQMTRHTGYWATERASSYREVCLVSKNQQDYDVYWDAGRGA